MISNNKTGGVQSHEGGPVGRTFIEIPLISAS